MMQEHGRELEMEAIEYALSVADCEALAVYYVKRSPDGRRSVRRGAVLWGGILLLICLLDSFPDVGTATLLPAMIIALACALAYPHVLARLVRRQARRRYSSGRNKTVLGWHRLMLLDRELREENEGGASSIRYDAIESVAETESHVFVHVTTVSAHVIPKSAVPSGALGSFVASLRERMERADRGSAPGFSA